MADKIARLTDIRAKNARLCGYRTPYNGPNHQIKYSIQDFAPGLVGAKRLAMKFLSLSEEFGNKLLAER